MSGEIRHTIWRQDPWWIELVDYSYRYRHAAFIHGPRPQLQPDPGYNFRTFWGNNAYRVMIKAGRYIRNRGGSWIDPSQAAINERTGSGSHWRTEARPRNPHPPQGAGTSAGPIHASTGRGTGPGLSLYSQFVSALGNNVQITEHDRKMIAQLQQMVVNGQITPQDAANALYQSGIPSSAIAAIAAGVDKELGDKMRAPQLETIQGGDPILAYRAARLVASRGGPKLLSLNAGMIGTNEFELAPEMYATCMANQGHKAPALWCRCGFYAVPADNQAQHNPTTIGLLVELSGTVIEHDYGYRAEYQRILQFVLPDCSFCGEPSTHVHFTTQEPDSFVCDDHRAGLTVSLEVLSKRFCVQTEEP